MKKILFLVSTLEKVGPTKQLYYILKYLDRKKFDPYVLTLSPESANSMWSEFDRICMNLASLNLAKVSSILTGADLVDKFVRTNGIDIVHSHFIRADYIASRLHVKRISTVRYNPDFVDRSGLGVLVVKVFAWSHYRILKKMDSVITCSKSLSEYFLREKKLKYKNINNSVDLFKIRPFLIDEKVKLRNKLSFSGWGKIFITVDSAIEGKNVEIIINSFAGRNNDLLIVAGKSPYLTEKYSNQKNIFFSGNVPNFSEYLLSADYFISASLSEGMPNAVLEAMAHGVPVILSDIDVHREIVEDTILTKYIFSCTDKRDLIHKIEEIINEDYQTVSNLARKIVETRFNAEEMTLQYQKEYDNVLDKSWNREE